MKAFLTWKKMQKENKEGNLMVLAIIIFIVFIVAAVTFSAYLLIDITKVSNLSNIHVTKSLKMAANNAKGNLYNNPEKGIHDWIIYTDRQNGFEVKYPADYVLEKSKNESGRVLTLKKSNNTPQGSNSLSSAIYVNIKNNADNSTLKSEIEAMNIKWNEEWSQKVIGGRYGIRTGRVTDGSGMEREVVLWQFGGKIFTLEEYHFNEDSKKDMELFEKIVSEFRFL